MCMPRSNLRSAPMIPFMTEDIYRNLVCGIDPSAPESVHLCDFPEADESMIDTALEAEMEEVLNAVVLGRSCRMFQRQFHGIRGETAMFMKFLGTTDLRILYCLTEKTGIREEMMILKTLLHGNKGFGLLESMVVLFITGTVVSGTILLAAVAVKSSSSLSDRTHSYIERENNENENKITYGLKAE